MSNVAIIPQNTVTLHGNLFKVHRGQCKRRGGGLRGIVKEFSRQSQARLVEKMLRLDWETIERDYCVRFVTLTTPTDYWYRLPFVYSCLDRMRRLFSDRGAAGAFVRRERGSLRGMLHFHMLVIIPRAMVGGWWPENEDLPEGWIGAAWRETLQYADRVRVRSEIPENWENVRNYITKYCSKTAFDTVEKTDSLPGGERASLTGGELVLSKSHNAETKELVNKTGHNGNRHWYVWGKHGLPWAVETVVRLGRNGVQETYKIKRVFRHVVKVRLQKKYMRRELGDLGKTLSDGDVKAVFLERCGASAMKHIMRSVSTDRTMKYFRKGWFYGWRLWCNANDIKILGELLFSENF